MRKHIVLGVAVLAAFISTRASAQQPDAPAPGAAKYPRVGGHVGLAVPLVTVASQTTAIGADYAKIGLAPGITIKLDERWAIDFEFVAYSNFSGSGNLTSIVIDPGVIYNFGFAAVGLRTAVHVAGGETQNWGFIPIILKGFPIGSGKVAVFVELDLPIFFNEAGAAMTVQPQVGVAF